MFSAFNVPIDDEDVSLLRQAIEILKKATDLNIINDIDDIVTKLENKVHTNVPNRATMIAFEEFQEEELIEEDFDTEEYPDSYGQSGEKYGWYNGWSDDAIDDAFEGDPENTWNVD